jgi:hypothetical protein
MDFAVPFLFALLGQAAEAATVTISFGDALAGGAVGGGIPLVSILGWLGIKKYRAKNAAPARDQQVINLLAEISAELKADKNLRQHQYDVQNDLQKRQLEVMINLEKSDSKVEDRLELVREELKDVRDTIRDVLHHP